ncbi:MAG: hypothetical protein R3182_06750, partial [Draconibacterium sp.]|nr:hypothetical protein [Draconibacterium sp.]
PLSEKLENAGFTFDFISDKQILDCEVSLGQIITSGKASYKAIVIPKTKYIPLSTMSQLVKFVAAGGKVYFDEYFPKSVPGIFKLKEREKELELIKSKISEEKYVGNVTDLLINDEIYGEKSLAMQGFHHLKMKLNGENWYLVFNIGKEFKDSWVHLNSMAKSYVLMNPMTGEITRAEMKDGKVRIQLDQEELVFIMCSDKKVNIPEKSYQNKKGSVFEISSPWQLDFIEGGSHLPQKTQINNLVSWTKLS